MKSTVRSSAARGAARNWGVWLLALSVVLAMLLNSVDAGASDTQVIYKRGYVDGRFGQIHYRGARPASGTTRLTPIVLFHQNPNSSYEYELLLRELGKDRVALAFDSPGYGESDRPAAPPSMSDLAGAMADALDALGYGEGARKHGPRKQGRGARKLGKVDVFGFHTGVFIAAELAVQRPDLVRRVVMSGIPFRPQDMRDARIAALPNGFAFTEDTDRVVERWARIVVNRLEGVDMERATRAFVEDLHSTGYWWYAYHAVWRYPVEQRFALIKQPIFILEPHEMDLEETRRAHRELLPHADYKEIPEIQERSRVFDLGWPYFARELRAWLDQPVRQHERR
jgi:pimeloyl-ACP methyl ester carboxylesterase